MQRVDEGEARENEYVREVVAELKVRALVRSTFTCMY